MHGATLRSTGSRSCCWTLRWGPTALSSAPSVSARSRSPASARCSSAWASWTAPTTSTRTQSRTRHRRRAARRVGPCAAPSCQTPERRGAWPCLVAGPAGVAQDLGLGVALGPCLIAGRGQAAQDAGHGIAAVEQSIDSVFRRLAAIGRGSRRRSRWGAREGDGIPLYVVCLAAAR
eukprot:15433744-Alexandrium_andersonii.AAC.1